MKKRILLFLCLVFLSAFAASAQSKRTVTNADLEKFRQSRVQAEREYRENYQRLGLPSPEELEKQREQSRKELAELSERLQSENQEREQRRREEEYRQAQIIYLRNNSSQLNQGAYNGYYPSGYFGAYPYYYGFSNGYYNNFYGNRFGKRGFGRGGNFYNSIIPGTVFPQQGVRINTGGIRIGITGGSRHPAPIRNPR